jgi:hypothetical protein
MQSHLEQTGIAPIIADSQHLPVGNYLQDKSADIIPFTFAEPDHHKIGLQLGKPFGQHFAVADLVNHVQIGFFGQQLANDVRKQWRHRHENRAALRQSRAPFYGMSDSPRYNPRMPAMSIHTRRDTET